MGDRGRVVQPNSNDKNRRQYSCDGDPEHRVVDIKDRGAEYREQQERLNERPEGETNEKSRYPPGAQTDVVEPFGGGTKPGP